MKEQYLIVHEIIYFNIQNWN